jgi:hypothetical protein
MGQRGRKSTASNLVALDFTGTQPRLTPPSTLKQAERVLFLELVNGCDPRHFVKSDIPLMVSFVQATILSRRTANPSMVGIWEKATRVQAMLATRLRLSPQARTDPKITGRQQARQQEDHLAPWHRDDKEDWFKDDNG